MMVFRGCGDELGKGIDMAAYVKSGIGDPWHLKKYVVEIKIMIIIKLVLE